MNTQSIDNKELNEIINSLSPDERDEFLKILDEYSSNGQSKILENLYSEDFTEVPVDIDTFIDSPRYAGWFTNNGNDIYPYWRNQLRNIFDDNDSYSEIAISGSIGTGKSHISVLALAYCLYKLMCLKDPHGYYKIAKGGYIYIVFFNATLALSQGVAYTKFQSLLQNSPWFLERGKVTGTKYLEYVPDMPIRFTIGSQMEHSIGKDILFGIMDEVNFCLTGDTLILTEDGLHKISDLDNKCTRVYSLDNDGKVVLSDPTIIAQTDITNDIYEIELEDGSIIKCTGNHLLMLKDGSYKKVMDITTEDELFNLINEVDI